MRTDTRIHALDAVRAFALLSGVALHASMTFMPGLTRAGFPADRSQSDALQALFFVIHAFRMPLFFFIAGFLAHLMVERRGALGFLRDRARRILVPLVVGWVLVGPLTWLLVYLAFMPAVAQTVSVASSAVPRAFPWGHLWFLYYLLLLYGVTLTSRWGLVALLDRHGRLRSTVDAVVRSMVRGPFAPLILAAPIALTLYLTPGWVLFTGIDSPATGFTPRLDALVGFGVAFVFGWLVHRQAPLMDVWRRRWLLHLLCAAAATGLSWTLQQRPDVEGALRFAYAVSYSVAAWSWMLGLVGASLRFCSSESAVRRYLADASYWVYLAHLPLVLALQLIVLRWNLHWAIKFPGIVIVATALLLVSYHFLVRTTFVGEALNGRRRPRASTAAIAAVQPRATMLPSSADATVAQLAGVRKQYGRTVALDGVDLQIRPGELLALLGPNGAGKSTAVSILLGLMEPDAGIARVFGSDPDSLEARRLVGTMLQEVALTPEHPVRDLVALTASYYAEPLAVDAVLHMTGLSPLAKRPYGKLSGGQKRQVQFAMAICGRPRLLFLDEPTSGLDVHARDLMWTTLRELVRQGCSIVLTTHYLEEAEALADRVAVMAAGRIIASGTVDDVRSLVARKRITCVSSVDPEQIRRWPGVTHAQVEGGRLQVTTADAETVARRLLSADPKVRELEIARAGLAEAFSELIQKVA